MSKKNQYKTENDENGEPLDPFFEMLQILDVEHLIRFRRRLEKVGRKKMVSILTSEIKEREAKEKADSEEERAKRIA
jgi:hypothetical protein